MSASNSIHIMGRITRDLELKYTASGVAVCCARSEWTWKSGRQNRKRKRWC